ncbi:major facilitator superfamily domain-containing protein [Crepidotus variabilis]|uniref:Major facilitator superfamily domain-containing protein n=1 Tax=Crepidotus variabilis TaxID=179855 RepID=A0A9P6E955_9AGAR|nr:major facilitator superfamily domain-containing protein [Crepidotus variabilis]
MEDATKEKYVPHSQGVSPQHNLYQRPKGLKGLYFHPATQLVMLGLVCFMCPGLFNALNGLGAGGQVDSATSSNANTALHATFSISAFFSGSINNRLGARMTLFLGSIGYALYIASYLAMNIHPSAGGFVIAAGTILGICAGLLWTAQGSLMLSYPTESQKGRFIGIFWAILNLGAVIGASVSLALNFSGTTNSVGNSTYIAFLVLTMTGAMIPLIMANPDDIVRTDGSKPAAFRHPSWRAEIYNLWVAVRDDRLVILLFPMFFSASWFYTWQFNGYNAALFTIQARSLNNLIYWVAQIVGSIIIGIILDTKVIGRRARAFTGWGILFFAVTSLHIWAYFYQKNYTRESVSHTAHKIGISDKGYMAKMWLYFFFGILDAIWQITVYWIVGTMSNDPAKLAHFTGLYKAFQSAGATGIWRADAVKTSYMNMFVSTWVLLIAGLLFALPMIHLRVKNTTDLEEKTQ